jgi:hypothetical protein
MGPIQKQIMMVTSSAQRLLHGGELRQPCLGFRSYWMAGVGVEVQWFFLGQDFGVVYLI